MFKKPANFLYFYYMSSKKYIKKYGDPTKLLFLDIDGVLNSQAFFQYSKQYQREKLLQRRSVRSYSLKKLDLLKEIHDKTRCTIVMSSTWRLLYFDKRFKKRRDYTQLRKDLKKRNIRIRYKTSNHYDYEELDRRVDKNLRSTGPITKFFERGYQINEFLTTWRRKYPNVKFVILDDDVGDLQLFKDNFVRTKWNGPTEEESGLTQEHVDRCIQILQ